MTHLRTLSTMHVSAFALSAASLVASPVMAQTATQEAEPVTELVVTGSRLKAGFDQPTPVSVVGAEQLAARAPSNIINVLLESPQFRNTNTQVGTRGTTAAGINSIDLRGLGPQETLILLDGRRLPSVFAGGPPDVNAIPGLLIDRVETVTGGASAAYGSDAMAGVVQFILKRNFEGLQATVQGGISSHGDDESVLAGFAWGKNVTDRLNIMVGGEYNYEKGVGTPLTRDWGRRESGLITMPANRPAGTPRRVFVDGLRFSTFTPGGLVTTGPLRGLEFLPGGQTGTFDFGTSAGGNLMTGSTSNYGVSPIGYSGGLKVGVERVNVLARATYDLGGDTEAWVEGNYFHLSTNQLSNMNYFRDPAANSGIIILRNNPYLPASVAAAMDANGLSRITIGRANDEIGPVRGRNTSEQFRVAAGLKGSFGGGWEWDGFLNYGWSQYKQIFGNQVLVANYNAALYAVRDGSGNIVCGDPLTNPNLPASQRAQVQAGCAPFNPFGLGSPSAAAVDYVSGTEVAVHKHHLYEGAFNVRGNLFDLPAGTVPIAFGVEARKVDTSVKESPLRGLFNTGNVAAFAGKYSVIEGYVETTLPILKDAFLARSLEVNGALRYADYSNFGGNTTWKVGVTWEPVEGVRFRGTRSRDVRAPTLGELFRSPVDANNVLTNRLTGVSGTVSTSQQSNPALQPEIGDTWVGGVVLTPKFASGLRLSMDYYKIRISDAIFRLRNAQDVIDFCQVLNVQNACGQITFAAPGTFDPAASPGFTFVSVANINAAVRNEQGLDFELVYSTSLDKVGLPGSLSINGSANYVIKSDNQSPGVLTNNRDVTNPRFRYNVRATYSDDWGAAYIQAIGFSKTRGSRETLIGPEDAGYDPTLDTSISQNRFPAYVYFNAGASFNVSEQFQLFVNVDNVLDRGPPSNAVVPGATTTTYAASGYDPIGRRYRAGVRVRM